MVKREPTKEDFVSAAMAERKDMLILAQQKLDEIHKYKIGRPYSSSRYHHKSTMSTHLLSSLLYVALMSYKIEDMKALLREEDRQAFSEWDVLLNSLHSPEFHAKERVVQNERVKTVYERKRQYKEVSIGLQEELTDTSNKLVELQKISNETSHQMSKAITALQDERVTLISNGEKKDVEINELKDELRKARSLVEKVEMNNKQRDEEISHLNEQLQSKDAIIKNLQEQNTQLLLDQAVAQEKASSHVTALKDLHSKLEQRESAFATFRSENESLTRKLYEEMKESEVRNAAVKTHFESSKEALDNVRKDLDSSRRSIESKLNDSNSLVVDIKEVLLNVESKLTTTESLMKDANGRQSKINSLVSQWMEKNRNLEKVSESNVTLQENVSRLVSQSDKANQSFASIQLDVAMTNESISKIERLYDRIKDTLANVQMSLSSTSTNDVIIARLENRSVHIEDILVDIQRMRNSETANEADVSLTRLEHQTHQIHEILTNLREILCTRLPDTATGSKDSFSILEDQTHQESDKFSSEAFIRLEDKTNEIRETLVVVHTLLSNLQSEKISSHSDVSSSQEDVSTNISDNRDYSNASTLAANDLVQTSVSEAVSAIRSSEIQSTT